MVVRTNLAVGRVIVLVVVVDAAGRPMTAGLMRSVVLGRRRFVVMVIVPRRPVSVSPRRVTAVVRVAAVICADKTSTVSKVRFVR